MRSISASVVLSSIILGSPLAGADAQSLSLESQYALNSLFSWPEAGSENLPPGVIPRPTIDSPGVVTGITVGELYTDNLRLAATGTPRQASWITQIQPFIRSAFSGPRFSGVFDYMLTGYAYAGQASHNQLTQSLKANGTLTIFPQHFFLDGSAVYGREVINNELAAGSGTFFLNNNQANVAIGTLSPYWLQDLGRVGTMSLRYTLGRVLHDNHGIPDRADGSLSGIPDITSNAVQFSLVSPKDQTWGWNLGYSDQRLDPDFGRTVEFAVAKVGTSFQVNNELQLLADGGKETKFLPDGTTQKLGSPFWDVGFAWANTRDDFRLLTGHRFYGRSYQLSWTHQAALLTTNVSYVEQPTTYNQQLLGLGSGTEVLPPIGIGSVIPSLTERQPYLSKRWSATAALTMPTSTLSLTAYDESRTYFLQNNTKERVEDAVVSWLFNLGAFTTLTPSLDWQRYQFRSGQLSYTHYAQLALVHQLDTRNFASLRLRRNVRTVYSGVPGAHGYDANVIFLQLTHLF